MSTTKLDSKAFKQQKKRQSRNIRSEVNDPALNKESILSVNDFLKSRKYEITELEKAQLSSKYASSTRVFQHLPRKLRRRTASHNVKRIPKRLRNRAIREMSKNDSPVIKKRKSRGQELYRLRTTRALLRIAAKATMSKLVPNETNLKLGKLKLRQRIKTLSKELKTKDGKTSHFNRINNKVGSYDISDINKLAPNPIGKLKFMKRQKDFVWLNSHVWHSKRAHMIKRWGYQIPSRPTQKCFRLTHRNLNTTGGITWDKSFIATCVLQSDNQNSIVDLLQKITKLDKIGKRYLSNGSIVDKLVYDNNGEILGEITIISFHNGEIYRSVLRVHPSIYQQLFSELVDLKTEDVEVIDNRFSIGSIDITGPISLKSLGTVLKPFDLTNKSSQIFSKLCTESSLPDNTIFTFEAQDPRLANRTKPKSEKNLDIHELLIEIKSTKSNIDNTVVDKLLTQAGRTASYENQLTLKDVERYKREKIQSNSKIPIVLYKNNGIWTVLLPWFWTLPVWYQLNHIAHLSFGGLFQTHQLQFERNKLHFPDDYPFTRAGIEENDLRSAFKKSKWDKKPKAKKYNYDKLKLCQSKDEYAKGELGDPFGCDWKYLQVLRIGLNKIQNENKTRTSDWDQNTQERKVVELHDIYERIKDIPVLEQETKQRGEVVPLPVKLSTSSSSSTTTPEIPTSFNTPLPIVPISLKVLGKGNPIDNARIYSIPPKQVNSWIQAISTRKPNGKKENDYPEVPHSRNLIGFITSGSYNLSKGSNTGVGAIDAVFAKSFKEDDDNNEKKYCLVRNVGTSATRLAIWEEIKL